VTPRYTDSQLDALRELANIASGTAATSLSQLLGREVDLDMPRAFAVSLSQSAQAAGDPESTTLAITLSMDGAIDGFVILLVTPESARTLCRFLGVELGTKVGDSALAEIGNILGAAYLMALSSMTGMALLPGTPDVRTGQLGEIVASVVARVAGGADIALVLDSELDVTGEACAISFMVLPEAGGVQELLAPLGLAEAAA
jgi:chemotaxis protein CheC